MKTVSFPLPPPNLPLLLPDQLLYDWCGRVHRWNGNTDVRDTSRQLFAAPYAALQHDFPAHLGELASRTNGTLASTADLALRHTLLGYYLPFLPSESARELLAGAIHGATPHLKFQLGLPASRLGADHPLKGCNDCFAEDEAGENLPYWRLWHQFPSALVCARHRRGLVVAVDSKTPVHRRDWILPRSGPQRTWTELAVPEGKMDILVKLASFSDEVARLAPGALDGETLAMAYQSSLMDKSFLTSAGNLRIDALVPFVREYFHGLEELPGLHVLRSIRSEWPGLVGTLARKSPRPGHPLKHLLLMVLLFETWQDFLARYDRVSHDTPGWCEPRPSSAPTPRDPRINTFVALINNRKLSVRAAAGELGVSVTTGVRWATLENIPFTRRTKTLDPKLLDRVRKLLRRGLPKTEVIAKSSISSVSLNRMISSEPHLRQQWLDACETITRAQNRKRFLALIRRHPGAPVKALRQMPGNGYDWLYRHDRQWLAEHLPSLWSAGR